MITHQIGEAGKRLHNLIVRGFAASGINPNLLTFIGFSINLLAAYLFAYGYFRCWIVTPTCACSLACWFITAGSAGSGT